eukprot:CAMPEP_0179012820 /NCGR_PEP_ID=MMETSP0796-20121207/1402_1 /TAXON_ID=73915 /ORGANISM="Pyrodinium bahamense, Strain pbaha01" /LENGTH=229 /DNA_ID=CAMNT_0020708293 /DNA_START=101 /DNA_END=790 /DNA_ORIENTATION=-
MVYAAWFALLLAGTTRFAVLLDAPLPAVVGMTASREALLMDNECFTTADQPACAVNALQFRRPKLTDAAYEVASGAATRPGATSVAVTRYMAAAVSTVRSLATSSFQVTVSPNPSTSTAIPAGNTTSLDVSSNSPASLSSNQTSNETSSANTNRTCGACTLFDPSWHGVDWQVVSGRCYNLAEVQAAIEKGIWCCEGFIHPNMTANPDGCFVAPNHGGFPCFSEGKQPC